MRKINVLLVDDNPIFLKTARSLIAAQPGVAGIECANSGAEALAQLDQLNPDLVLTDIVMPEMSGFELIRNLRARNAPPRVVAVTLHAGAEFRAAALRSGAEGLVSKREFSTVAPDLITSMASTGNTR